MGNLAGSAALLIVENGLRRRFAQLKLVADFLQPCSERVNLLLLPRNYRSLLLHDLMFFEKLIEQHRVHRFVAHNVKLAFFVAR